MSKREINGFVAGGVIGTLGGLIGLGGAEFRLPVLVGKFHLPTLEAVILNKAMSLIVVASALIFRGAAVDYATLFDNIDIVLNLLLGSLVGAWFAAGVAVKLRTARLNQLILVLLVMLSIVMLWEALFGLRTTGEALLSDPMLLGAVGVLAGLVIGIVAAVLGVAGGELLIPTIVLLYGADIRLAGSLSLMVSLPTMLVGFARYAQADAFQVLKNERALGIMMALGSIVGAAIGGLLIGLFSTRLLIGILAVVLIISAYKTFQHCKH